MRDPEEGVDEHGYIVTGVRADRVPAPFQPIVGAAVRTMAEHTACSLYLYGSVATGVALSPSDVDLLTVGLDADVASSVAHTLSDQFRDRCRCVDVAVVQPADLVGDTCAAALASFSVTTALICADPQSTPVCLATRQTNEPLEHSTATSTDTRNSGSMSSTGRRKSRWACWPGVARKTLLALTGLVSVHDGIWTTDRESGVRRWSEIEPDRADELDMLRTWSTVPPEVAARDVAPPWTAWSDM